MLVSAALKRSRQMHCPFLIVSIRSCIVLLCLFALPLKAATNENVLDYFFEDIELAGTKNQRLFQQTMGLIRKGQLDNATEVAEELVNQNDKLAETQPIRFGKLLANLGILLAKQGLSEDAIATLDPASTYIESRANPYSQAVLKVTLARAVVQETLEHYEIAEESFRRAQHITHRIGGVYTTAQFDMVNHITQINLAQGKAMEADREQEFKLRISEQAYGGDSEQIVPNLLSLGAYFASRGEMIPARSSAEARYYRDSLIRRSQDLYRRAIIIIEDNYGELDLRLIEPLRGLARAKLSQKMHLGAAEHALERTLSIIEANPDTGIPDRLKAMIQLADLYTISNDRRAWDMYRAAWVLTESAKNKEQLQTEIFGEPKRLHPDIPGTLYLDQRPNAAIADINADLFIDFGFVVTATGRVKNIEVLEANVPYFEVRYLRALLAIARYRPRIQDGDLVETQDLVMHQRFSIVEGGLTDADINVEQYEDKKTQTQNIEDSS